MTSLNSLYQSYRRDVEGTYRLVCPLCGFETTDPESEVCFGEDCDEAELEAVEEKPMSYEEWEIGYYSTNYPQDV